MDPFAFKILSKLIRSFLQHLLRLYRNPSVGILPFMPPAIIQMIKIEMRKNFCKFLRGSSNIAAMAKALSYQRIDLKLYFVSKHQTGRL